MTNQEILECLERKLAYQKTIQEREEWNAIHANARARLAERICEGLAIDIQRLRDKIREAA